MKDLMEENTIDPLVIPEDVLETPRGERPSASQIELLQRQFGVDAVLYGQIPWYGRTRLIYPILGETLDITAESIVLGLATNWYSPLS